MSAEVFFALVIGVCTLGFGIVLERAIRSIHWPSTIGYVECGKVIGGRGTDDINRYQIKLRYKYVVNGKEYVGSEIEFFGPTGSKRKLTEICHHYQEKHEVCVYYDPRKPIYSVLKPGVTGDALLPIVVLVGLWIFVIVMWCV